MSSLRDIILSQEAIEQITTPPEEAQIPAAAPEPSPPPSPPPTTPPSPPPKKKAKVRRPPKKKAKAPEPKPTAPAKPSIREHFAKMKAEMEPAKPPEEPTPPPPPPPTPPAEEPEEEPPPPPPEEPEVAIATDEEIKQSVLTTLRSFPDGIRTANLQSVVHVALSAEEKVISLRHIGRVLLNMRDEGEAKRTRIKGKGPSYFWFGIEEAKPSPPPPPPEEPPTEAPPPPPPIEPAVPHMVSTEKIQEAIYNALAEAGVGGLLTKELREMSAVKAGVTESRVRTQMTKMEATGKVQVKKSGKGAGKYWSLTQVERAPTPPPPEAPPEEGEITDERIQELMDMGDVALLEVWENPQGNFTEQEREAAENIIESQRLTDIAPEREKAIRGLEENDLFQVWKDEAYSLGDKLVARAELQRRGAFTPMTYEGVDMRQMISDIMLSIPLPTTADKIYRVSLKHPSRGKLSATKLKAYIKEVLPKMKEANIVQTRAGSGKYDFEDVDVERLDPEEAFTEEETTEESEEMPSFRKPEDYQAAVDQMKTDWEETKQLLDSATGERTEKQNLLEELRTKTAPGPKEQRKIQELQSEVSDLEENIRKLTEMRSNFFKAMNLATEHRLNRIEQIQEQLETAKGAQKTQLTHELEKWTMENNRIRAEKIMTELGFTYNPEKKELTGPGKKDISDFVINMLDSIKGNRFEWTDIDFLRRRLEQREKELADLKTKKAKKEEIQQAQAEVNRLKEISTIEGQIQIAENKRRRLGDDLNKLEKYYHMLIAFFPGASLTEEVSEEVEVGLLAPPPKPVEVAGQIVPEYTLPEQGPILTLEDAIKFAEGEVEGLLSITPEEAQLYQNTRADFAAIRMAIDRDKLVTKGGVTVEQVIEALGNVPKGRFYYQKLFSHQPDMTWTDAFRRSNPGDPGLHEMAQKVSERANPKQPELAEFEYDYWKEGGTFPVGGLQAQQAMDRAVRQGFFASEELQGNVADIVAKSAGENEELLTELISLRDDLSNKFEEAPVEEARRWQSEIDFVNTKIGQIASATDKDIPIAYGVGPIAERGALLKKTLSDVISDREWNRLNTLEGLESLTVKLRIVEPLDAEEESDYQHLLQKKGTEEGLTAEEKEELEKLKTTRDKNKKSKTIHLAPQEIVRFWNQDIEDRLVEFEEARQKVVAGEISASSPEFTDLWNLTPQIEELAEEVEKPEDWRRLAVAVLMAMSALNTGEQSARVTGHGRYQQLKEMAEVLAKAEIQQLRHIARSLSMEQDEEKREEWKQKQFKIIHEYDEGKITWTKLPKEIRDLYRPIRQFPLLPRHPAASKEARESQLAEWLQLGLKKGDIAKWSPQTLVEFIDDNYLVCDFNDVFLIEEWKRIEKDAEAVLSEAGKTDLKKRIAELQKCATTKARIIQSQSMSLTDPENIRRALEEALTETPPKEMEIEIAKLQSEKQELERQLGEQISPDIAAIQDELDTAKSQLRSAVSKWEKCIAAGESLEEQLKAERAKEKAAEVVVEKEEELAETSPEAARATELEERIKRLETRQLVGGTACFSVDDMETLVDSLLIRKAKNTIQLGEYQALIGEQKQYGFTKMGYDEDLHWLQYEGQQLDDVLSYIQQQGADAFVCPVESS